MRLPFTLSVYIARQFLVSILITLLILLAIVMLGDVVELVRRASKREFVPFSAVVSMAFLKSPNMVEKVLPFAVLIGSMHALLRLTRAAELIVARAAGVSVWQFLAPAVMVVMTLGMLSVSFFNPLAAVMLLRYERLEAKYLTGQPSLIAVSSSGLWLRQVEESDPRIGEHIIHAERVLPQDTSFERVIIFTFGKKGEFTERLDAERARLAPGYLELDQVIRSVPGLAPERITHTRLATELEIAHIQDSFASPETMPFWTLPAFIATLEKAGFSALRHRIYWQSLLATPLLLAGMVLIAAVFSLKSPRHSKVGPLAAAGLVIGFGLYFFTDIVHALGAAGTLPVAMAAWTPAFIMLAMGAAILLQLEDG